MVSGVVGIALRATAVLDPDRAGLVLVPGAAGRIGDPGEVPEHEAGAAELRADPTVPELTGTSRADRLPASRVTGRRRTLPAVAPR